MKDVGCSCRNCSKCSLPASLHVHAHGTYGLADYAEDTCLVAKVYSSLDNRFVKSGDIWYIGAVHKLFQITSNVEVHRVEVSQAF